MENIYWGCHISHTNMYHPLLVLQLLTYKYQLFLYGVVCIEVVHLGPEWCASTSHWSDRQQPSCRRVTTTGKSERYDRESIESYRREQLFPERLGGKLTGSVHNVIRCVDCYIDNHWWSLYGRLWSRSEVTISADCTAFTSLLLAPMTSALMASLLLVVWPGRKVTCRQRSGTGS